MSTQCTQVLVCPVDADGFRNAIAKFARKTLNHLGQHEINYWYYREQQFPILAADADHKWYLVEHAVLSKAVCETMYNRESWPVPGLTWYRKEYDTRPSSRESLSFYRETLSRLGLTELGSRGSLDSMFAGTWSEGDEDFSSYIKAEAENTRKAEAFLPGKAACLRPRSPLDMREETSWYGVGANKKECFTALHLMKDEAQTWAANQSSSQDTLVIYLDDPLFHESFFRAKVRDARLKIQCRSGTSEGRQLLEISSPTVFSNIEVLSGNDEDWSETEADLVLESTSYADWADACVQITPLNPVEISFVEILVSWSRE